MPDYTPNPIDTSPVTLSDDLVDLTEKLAENAHEHWAKLRMKEGWTFGPSRNDTRKEHPNLVPYEQLSEADKAYDRQTAMETIKAVISPRIHHREARQDRL